MLSFAENLGVTFPVMFDESNTYPLYDKSGATAPYPLDVVVDQSGVVRYISTHYDPDELKETLDTLLSD